MSEDEVGQRIMSELEEAGEENVAAMLNAIISPSGEITELETYIAALSQLVKAGFISISTIRDEGSVWIDSTRDEALALVAALRSTLRFSIDGNRWTWAQPIKPQIVATEAGMQRAHEIADLRGYQWWRVRGHR